MDATVENLQIKVETLDDSDDFVQEVEKFSEAFYPSNLEMAVNDVRAGKLTAVEASRQYNVNRSTINNRVLGRCQGGIRGRERKIPEEAEQELADYLTDCADLGDPRSKHEFLVTVGELAKLSPDPDRHFNNDMPSHKWFIGFKNRHPEVRFRKPQEVTRAAAKVKVDDIVKFIQGVRNYLQDKGLLHLLHDANQFGVGDEYEFELNPSLSKFLAKKDSVHKVQNVKAKDSIIAFYTVLASGVALEPQLVFKSPLSKLVSIAESCREVGANFPLTHTPKGLQTQESFFNYLSTKFIEELDERGVRRTPDCPFVLFLDAHLCHKSFRLFKWGKENNIIVIILLPNAKHILQPLDVGIFDALKTEYVEQIKLWKVNQKETSSWNKKLDEVSFVQILKKTNDAVLTSEIIRNSFRATGLFPLDESAVYSDRIINLGWSHQSQYPQEIIEKIGQSSLSENSSLPDNKDSNASSLPTSRELSTVVPLPPQSEEKSLLKMIRDGFSKLSKIYHGSGETQKFRLTAAAFQILSVLEEPSKNVPRNVPAPPISSTPARMIDSSASQHSPKTAKVFLKENPTTPKQDLKHKNCHSVMTPEEVLSNYQEVNDKQMKGNEENDNAEERQSKNSNEILTNIEEEKLEATKRKPDEDLLKEIEPPKKRERRPKKFF